MRAGLVVTTAAATHPGLRRALNEDAHLASAPVFLVADGMGGHEAGERASAAVITEFARYIGRPALELDDVRHALTLARASVEELSTSGNGRAGTTLSGVVIASVDGMGYWLTVNIGDSRTYRFADGELEQISVDHSVVQELIESGELTPEEAVSDRRRNIITRAIGASSTGDADYWMFPAELGDRILVCSDGLTSEVPDARIREVLATEPDPQLVVDALTADAVAAGGRDNITVIVVDAVSVASRPGTLLATDDADIDLDTRPREAAAGGVR
ncbi:PP2C family serine/threonine-protein phosphatase [Microbacterium sp. Se5.02b]|uniref:PP2C family protein-serine/threonine phosphatase n=1 Tax=Microbacterium sp. Se5.02b TaxID=2864103 RepID=UPI001604D2FA|nr:protein phosphatase 2C domain-containing protein [Microbacterium sp. Se5.02b]QNA91683.1 serine/threonine-protein phosphatase [Microbacterium sp. Se63.02b]QYM64872.1 protein phosphatase 2C domain-containing protein [Microbacterium sp. Se5.02b]